MKRSIFIKHLPLICALFSILSMRAAAQSAGYDGAVGDHIDYLTGTLTLSETDVTQLGRHGLDIKLTRTYSSMTYGAETVDGHDSYKDYSEVNDPEKYSYLGDGWYIGYPYVFHTEVKQGSKSVHSSFVVYQDGSSEQLFRNLDTLTEQNWPMKSHSFALYSHLNPFGDTITTPDTLMFTDGTKWVFGIKLDNMKLLTQMLTRFGDSLIVDYYQNSRWIKHVTSHIGRTVLFRYCNGRDTVLLPADSTPPDTAKLFELHYLNHRGDTLKVKYRYHANQFRRNLRAVIYPTGDSSVFSYVDSALSPTNQWYKTDSLYYVNSYRTPSGAATTYEYKSISRPIYLGKWDSPAPEPIDTTWDYNSYVSVSERRTADDTVRFSYDVCHNNLYYSHSNPFTVGSKTEVTFSDTSKEQYYFFIESQQEWKFIGNDWYYPTGIWPGALYQMNGIYGNDTVCTGYDYGGGLLIRIGQHNDSTFDTVFQCCDGEVDHVDTVFDTSSVYQYYKMSVHKGVAYYDEGSASYPYWTVLRRTGAKDLITSYTVNSVDRPNLNIFSVTAPRTYQLLYRDDYDSLSYPEYELCPWSSCGGTPENGICYPLISDTLPFVKDSVLNYQYVPQFNLTLVMKQKHLVFNHGKAQGMFTVYEYDSTKAWELSRTLVFLDTTYYDAGRPRTTDTLITRFAYDSDYNLYRRIGPTNDTVYYVYDSLRHALLWKTIDSSLGGVIQERRYYANGQDSLLKGRNGEETLYLYDRYGRDSLVRRPLETEYSTKFTYDNPNQERTWQTKIDSGLETTTSEISDALVRPIKRSLKVNDTVSIADTLTYDKFGSLVKTGRAKFSSESSYAWTQYKVDKQLRRYKTVFPDSTLTDSVTFQDYYTTDYRSEAGLKTRQITDFFGNVIRTYVGAETTSTFSPIDTSYTIFGPFGNPLEAHDYKGLSRTYQYDEWGRRTMLVDPDVGTMEFWYNRAGNLRFLRYSDEEPYTYTYFIYDRDQRLIEEGTIGQNISLDSVESYSYPGTSSGKTVKETYRYDSYSASQIAADSSGGLGNSKGRLTEVYDRNGNDTTGYTYYYYDKRGRVGLKTTWISGLTTSKKLRFQYYANDALKRITYPDTSKHTVYSYLQTGQLRGISDVIGQDSISYEGWGAVKEVKFKNNLKSKYAYDNVGRIASTVNFQGSNKYFSRVYSYDANKGYLVREYNADTSGNAIADTTRIYTYDYLGRLTQARVKAPTSYSYLTRTVSYSYDPNNNLTHRKIAGIDSLYYTLSANGNFNSKARFSDDSCYVLSKDTRGRTTRLTKYQDTLLSTWNYRRLFQYDYRNLLARVIDSLPSYSAGDYPDTVWNLYDASGHKVRQIYTYHVYVSGGGGGGGGEEGMLGFGEDTLMSLNVVTDTLGTDGTTPPGPHWERRVKERYYIWAGNQVILELDNPNTVTEINIYGLGKQLARRFPTKTDSLHVLITDYHGSLRSEVPFGSGYGADLIEYYPYGELFLQSGTNLTYREFIGKERDYSRELDFGPRYYNATVGRFLSPDPILSAPSAYAYTDGNPIMQYDPDGLKKRWIITTYMNGKKIGEDSGWDYDLFDNDASGGSSGDGGGSSGGSSNDVPSGKGGGLQGGGSRMGGALGGGGGFVGTVSDLYSRYLYNQQAERLRQSLIRMGYRKPVLKLNWLADFSKGVGRFGEALGWAGVAINGMSFFADPNWEDGTGAVVGAVVIVSGAWTIGVAYYIVDVSVGAATGHGVGYYVGKGWNYNVDKYGTPFPLRERIVP